MTKDNIVNFEFGCEFEFYVNQMLEDELIDELNNISSSKVIINRSNELNQKNHNDCINYKRDASLTGDTGREITTPICSLEELKDYIRKISKIINNNAQTNEDTGFHIHISTANKSIDVDFYRFMLLANDQVLLTNWGSRNGYSLNVMSILDVLDMEEAKQFKNKKGRIWNLEKRDNNHLEIRTMGGSNYHNKVDKILKELDTFIETFQKSINKPDKEYITIFQNHINALKSCDTKRRDKFLEVINKNT